MLDLDRFTDTLVAQTVKAIATAQAPILARLDTLERMFAAIPAPQAGAPGKDADPEAVAALVYDKIRGQIEALQEVLDAPSELPDIPAMVDEAVKTAVAAFPVPKDGTSGIDGAPGQRGEMGPPGRDGLDVKDMLRADGGRLVAVMSDGTTRDLGVFVGKDGKDGAPGRDGADGLGFEDVTFDYDDHGRPVAKFQRGDVVKTFPLPCIIDRGTYDPKAAYRKGDAVSWGGSLWIAQKDAPAGKPGEGDDFRLAVKKGRDGRDTEAKKVL